MNRSEWPFTPITSSAPSFNASASGTVYLFESTIRKWQGPGGRAVRLSVKSTQPPVTVGFGSSGEVAAVAGSDIVVLNGTVEVFGLQPGWNSMMISATTDAIVNVTPGYGQ